MVSWIILLFFLTLEASCMTRVKRILHGDRVHGRENGYNSVNYFAAFGTAHGKPWWLPGFWNLAKKHGLYGEIICGGALLTPRIVQTACHCIATFPYGYRDVYVDPALINDHWEGTMVVYLGTNYRFPTWGHENERSMLNSPGINSEKFFVHPKCGKMPQTSNVHVSFDTALIRINGQWQYGYHGVRLKTTQYAPLYTITHIKEMFNRFTEAQTTCLIIGFGYYGVDYPYQSDVMRHGWATLRDYRSCIWSTTQDIPSKNNYTEYLSWACARPIMKFDQSAEPGDSGGPVSCDNQFFGIISSMFYETEDMDEYRTELFTANVYTPFINTYGGREHLMELIENKNALSYAEEVRHFYKTSTREPELKRMDKINQKPEPQRTNKINQNYKAPQLQRQREHERYLERIQISRSPSALDFSWLALISVPVIL